MSGDNPTIRERLARVEQALEDLQEYVTNGLTHRIGRIEWGIIALLAGVAGTLLLALLGRLP